MEKDVFSYLEKDYTYLRNYIKDMNEALFTIPHSAIIKGRTFAEKLTQEIGKLSGLGLLSMMNQVDRLEKLERAKVISGEIYRMFHEVRKLGNKAAHDSIEGELEAALNMHKNIYKITCWFVKKFIDETFEAPEYKNPIPSKNLTSGIDADIILKLLNSMETIIEKTQSVSAEDELITTDSIVKEEKDLSEEVKDKNTLDIRNVSKKCLIDKLSHLKESSREAVEGLGKFSDFKRYMHIEREPQNKLQELIFKAYESEKAQLILVCGSVGDGKSHIISYFYNEYPDMMNNFNIHNDATESLEPNKTSTETLNMVLDNFSDEKIDQSHQKLILAINLGTLNNFIDSEYGKRFTKLKKFVRDRKILETGIENNDFDSNSSFQFINFSDYHMFTLTDGKVRSEYIKTVMRKITATTDNNFFYKSYKENCSECVNCKSCPIKANYELLANEKVQEEIIDLLVQCIIKDKIIISTRALLNFIYEIIVPVAEIDVNSIEFKRNIQRLNHIEYIKALMPNLLFNHKELSFIFESFSNLDPLNIRSKEIDDFILEFNNSADVLGYFKKYLDYPEGYIGKMDDVKLEEIQKHNIRFELLKLFIRSYRLCGKGEIFSLKDTVYEEFMRNIYYWNRGDKIKLKGLYDDVENGILKWNGDAGKDQVNTFLGKKQIKYRISENINLKVDTSNLPKNNDTELNKFITTIKLKYRSEKTEQSYEIDLDYSLYKLLIQVNQGYRPNNKDKNHFIKFVEVVSKIEENGSQNEKLIFTEKNRDINKKYKLEYDKEFEFYRFVEM